MKILSRYLLKEHLGPFGFAALALTGLLILNQVAIRLPNLIGKGLPWGVIGSVFGLSMPFILAMTVPMAVLVAVLHAFTRLGADSEVTALKASGVNLVRLVRPVLVAGILLSFGELVFVDQVLPRANHRLKNLLVDIARKKPTFNLLEQSVNEVVPGQFFLRAGRIDQASDRMRDVVIYDLANPSRRRTIYADSGYIRFNAAQTDLFLTLFDGYIHDYDKSQAETFRRIFFNTDLVRIPGVSNQLDRTEANDNFRGDRELSVCEMEAIVVGDLRSAAAAAADRRRAAEHDALTLVGVAPPPADTLRTPSRRSLTALYCSMARRLGGLLGPGVVQAQALPQRPRRQPPGFRAGTPPPVVVTGQQPATGDTTRRTVVLPTVGSDRSGASLRGAFASYDNARESALRHAAGYQVEIHKKYSLAVSCIVFVLIGAPVALRFPRGGIGLVIGASVAIFGLYYIGLIGGEALGNRRIVHPFWAMWTPNLLMATAGMVLFLRLGREQATARSGGWAWPWRRRRRAR